MANNSRYETVANQQTRQFEEPLTPYSAAWKADARHDDHNEILEKSGSTWSSKFSFPKRLGNSANNTQGNTWATLRHSCTTSHGRKQILAFSLLLCCGIVPFFILGHFSRFHEENTGTAHGLFSNSFKAKTIPCTVDFYDGGSGPANQTFSGIEGLFILDRRFGQYTFSTVKAIDLSWDILVGRGVQAFAWWASYLVFTDAILRVIERHPASFRVFKHITLEGASLTSLWALIRGLAGAKSRRTRALYGYMAVSVLYVVLIPIFLSAMTGYDSTTAVYASIDDASTMIPASTLERTEIIFGANGTKFAQPTCLSDVAEFQKVFGFSRERQKGHCDCQLPDGTILPWDDAEKFDYNYTAPYNATLRRPFDMLSYCGSTAVLSLSFGLTCLGIFNFPNNTQTYKDFGEVRNCNATMTVRVNNQTYDTQTLHTIEGYCDGQRGYGYFDFLGKTRCMPDISNPAYQWGFSTQLATIFMILQLAWCLSMYAIWQDAQFNSTLVQNGYRMNPLRAMLALVEAMRRKTGMGVMDLIRADRRMLETELFGKRKRELVTVCREYFTDGVESGSGDLKRRSWKTSQEDD